MTVGNLDRRDIKHRSTSRSPTTSARVLPWQLRPRRLHHEPDDGREARCFQDEVIARISSGSHRIACPCASTPSRTRSHTGPRPNVDRPSARVELRLPGRPRAGVRHRERVAAGTATTCVRVIPAASSGNGKVVPRSPCRRASSSSSRRSTSRSRSRTGSLRVLARPHLQRRSPVQRLGCRQFNFYIDYFLNETDLTSHEFQFSGGGDRIKWVGGAYFWDRP